jgi:hypothetical protein
MDFREGSGQQPVPGISTSSTPNLSRRALAEDSM